MPVAHRAGRGLCRGPPSPRHRRGAGRAHAGLGPALAKPTAWAALGIAARATPVRAAGGDRAGRLRAARRRRRPPAQPTPTQPGCAPGRRRNEDAPMSLRPPKRRERLHGGGVRECKTVRVLPWTGVSGVNGTRTGLGSTGSSDGWGAPSMPVPCVERAPGCPVRCPVRCARSRTEFFRRVRSSGTNTAGWHGGSGRTCACAGLALRGNRRWPRRDGCTGFGRMSPPRCGVGDRLTGSFRVGGRQALLSVPRV